MGNVLRRVERLLVHTYVVLGLLLAFTALSDEVKYHRAAFQAAMLQIQVLVTITQELSGTST